MDTLALLLIALAVAIGSWFMGQWLLTAFNRYQRDFQHEASHRLEEFFLFLDPARVWQLNMLACLVLFLLVGLLSLSVWLGALAAVAGMLVPRLFIKTLRRRRAERFEQQLPDLLLALSSALRAGSGVQSALRQIVAQAPAPLGQEFGLMLREQRMGVPFEQALAHLYQRVPTEGMGLLSAALNVAMQSGGNLAETLERIASTLRARLHLLGRVRALTSQGRMQSWVMASLPLVLAFVLDWLEPEVMGLLWHSGPGWAVLAIIAVLEVAGIWMIRRIVAIQV